MKTPAARRAYRAPADRRDPPRTGAPGSPADRTLCIVLHDVAPATWSACRWQLDAIAALGDHRVTLLAVPRFHAEPRSDAFERWLRERAALGDEVALHGFDHVDGGVPRGPIDRLRRRFYTRGEAEFWDLDFDDAMRRLRAGLAWLRSIGIVPAGFVAPAWLLGGEAWRAVRALPFDYTCTLRRIHLLDRGRSRPPGGAREIVCQSQVYSSSSAWRQQLSVLWNESLAWRQRSAPLVRLELHPGDDVPVIRRSWQRLLEQQAQTRRVRTLQEAVERFRRARVPPPP